LSYQHGTAKCYIQYNKNFAKTIRINLVNLRRFNQV
jgi:hypothetical protein